MSSVSGLQLCQDIPHVSLHGVLYDAEYICRDLVRIAFRDAAEHFKFSVRESLVRDVRSDLRRDFVRDSLLTGVNLPDDRDQLRAEHAFQEIPDCAQLQSTAGMNIS